MRIGGVEKSFLNLLSTIDRKEYEVHLGLFEIMGGYLDHLPNDIIVHEIDCYKDKMTYICDPPQQVIKSCLKKFDIIGASIYLVCALLNKYFQHRYLLYKYILRHTPVLDEGFDVAVSYQSLSEVNDFYLINKVKASKKIAWVHFDAAHFGMNRSMAHSLFKHYDTIYIVAKDAKESFDRKYPQFAHKTRLRYNVLDKNLVLRMSEEPSPYTDGLKGHRILTVGRISKEKGQDLALKSAKLLKESGVDFKWYFVGDGIFRPECEALAKELCIEENVEFLGSLTNPYPYMKYCDIYVQPSRYEAYCTTVGEALCFDIPVVATNVSGTNEQIKDTVKHRICDINQEKIYQAIIEIINR